MMGVHHDTHKTIHLVILAASLFAIPVMTLTIHDNKQYKVVTTMSAILHFVVITS